MCDNAPKSMIQVCLLRLRSEVHTTWAWTSRQAKSSFELKIFGLTSDRRTWFWDLCEELEFGLGCNDKHLCRRVDSYCRWGLQCDHIIGALMNLWAREVSIKTASAMFPFRISFCCLFRKSRLLMSSSVDKFLSSSNESKIVTGLSYLETVPFKIAMKNSYRQYGPPYTSKLSRSTGRDWFTFTIFHFVSSLQHKIGDELGASQGRYDF